MYTLYYYSALLEIEGVWIIEVPETNLVWITLFHRTNQVCHGWTQFEDLSITAREWIYMYLDTWKFIQTIKFILHALPTTPS